MPVGIPLGYGHNSWLSLSLSFSSLPPPSLFLFLSVPRRSVFGSLRHRFGWLSACGRLAVRLWEVGCPPVGVPPQSGWAHSLAVRAWGHALQLIVFLLIALLVSISFRLLVQSACLCLPALRLL